MEEIYLFPSNIEQDDDDYIYDQDNFIEVIAEELTFPCTLRAENSNWRGQTGYAEVTSPEELFKKIFSFGNNEVSFRKEDEEYYFYTASHDRPTGFAIYVENK